MPMTGSVAGKASGSSLMTNGAKYLPAGSLMTVTLDGTHGSGRDRRTDTSPTMGRRSLYSDIHGDSYCVLPPHIAWFRY
jgi:hypothetical protein